MNSHQINNTVKTYTLDEFFEHLDELKKEFVELEHYTSAVFGKPTYNIDTMVIDYSKSAEVTNIVVDYTLINDEELIEKQNDEIPTLKEFMEAHGLL